MACGKKCACKSECVMSDEKMVIFSGDCWNEIFQVQGNMWGDLINNLMKNLW